ncbi:hypothetical protein MYCTH_2124880 [Thermothelomyces thermophilus ATCC 42464]|uniref:Uncharacterized protein n=1 Tax=Thermothelomyces thermophilus (strain ATCC 42464 / BCRC 31852 / DSM 1799) TaxID=573729 RepID=G2QAS7_THET4|nr:uncharacterized protein MYCTH_2124880 [Thermothelomyces thermophilus ATCC 42464]AEO55919.1 hypothetical protein MYCTH_2124880 [Thermothelomyces thermophilus ATCC 42464]
MVCIPPGPAPPDRGGLVPASGLPPTTPPNLRPMSMSLFAPPRFPPPSFGPSSAPAFPFLNTNHHLPNLAGEENTAELIIVSSNVMPSYQLRSVFGGGLEELFVDRLVSSLATFYGLLRDAGVGYTI